MKQLLVIIGLALLSLTTQAQVRGTTVSTDTLTNHDTVYVTYPIIASNVKALQAKVTKLSGTVAGYATLEATLDGSNWYTAIADTLTLTNITTNFHAWTITSTSYYGYRMKFVTTGTSTATAAFTYLIRRDEPN